MNNSLAYLYLHTHTYIEAKKNCNRHNLIIDDGKSIEIMCISNVHKYYKTVLVHSEKHSFQHKKKEQFEIKLFFFLVEISYILYAYTFLSTCIYLIDPTCAINVQSE